MRHVVFTLLAIALSITVQSGLDALPLFHAMRGFGTALFFLSPVAVTAGLAYAMRVDFYYALVAAFLSPLVSWVLGFLIAVFVFNQQAYI